MGENVSSDVTANISEQPLSLSTVHAGTGGCMPEMRAERPGWQSAIDSEDNTSQTAGRMQLRHQNGQSCFRQE